MEGTSSLWYFLYLTPSSLARRCRYTTHNLVVAEVIEKGSWLEFSIGSQSINVSPENSSYHSEAKKEEQNSPCTGICT